MTYILEFKNISKSFGSNQVLSDISFKIKKGSIHALLGENGAGKSTLLNILQGIYCEYEGCIIKENKVISFNKPKDAFKKGIVKVHQEINLVEELTVGQNIALGHEPQSWGIIKFDIMYKQIDKILNVLKCDFRSKDIVKKLNTAQMQQVLIAKALYHNAQIIAFDEPTTALSSKEIDELLNLINHLKNKGITIIYISHRLDEVFKISDQITVLRDGVVCLDTETKLINKDDVIKNMIGRDLSKIYIRDKMQYKEPHQKVLEVNSLNLENVFQDINFYLYKGEVLGFSGLVGAKRTSVVKTLFGVNKATSGEIKIHNKSVKIDSPEDAVKLGIGLIPEERKSQGLIRYKKNYENIAIASMEKFLGNFSLNIKKMINNAYEYGELLHINPKSPYYLTENLSGGNQQKIVLAKWLTSNPEILIFDEPTKGIDIGAKEEIYKIINNLTKQGKSIIIVSSELPEIIRNCDRVIVMREGRITGELTEQNINEEKIMSLSMKEQSK